MQSNYHHCGWLEVIAGCMGSGKREELARRLRRALLAHKPALLFLAETRDYPAEPLEIAAGEAVLHGLPIQEASHILAQTPWETEIVAIDSVHLLDPAIVDTVSTLTQRGTRVITTGLDTDFRGQTFGPMGDLLAQADMISKLTAFCAQCGGRATRSQRLVNGRPASADSPVVLIDSVEYAPRCRACHMVPE